MEPTLAVGRILENYVEEKRVAVRYCLYARKSTEQDEMQALSIESQVKEMLSLAEKNGLDIAETRRESHSAKANGQRPIFNQLLVDMRAGKFNGILCWHPDRLSRNAGDLGALVDLMDQKVLVEIRTYSQKFTNNPNEKFLLMILGSQAKLENDNKSINVKRGLKTRVEMGLWPCIAPTGYLNEKRTDKKCEVMVDPKRAPIIKQMFEKVAYEQWSGRRLFKWLKDDVKFMSKNDRPLSLGNIYRLLRFTFYYGVFEYPTGSGNWYTGKHSPIISKELFDKVQEHLYTEQGRMHGIEFAFTKIMHCGYCGSGITAEEQFKKLKDGGQNRHVYYRCTKSRDKECTNPPLKEGDLIELALELIDSINLDKTTIRERLAKEVERYSKFQTGVLGEKDISVQKKELDIKNYAKYLLKEGSTFEKREMLSCIKSGVVMKDRRLVVG